MGSSQQVIVGVLLLACAFIFGRYVHNRPLENDSGYAEVMESQASDQKLSESSVFQRNELQTKSALKPATPDLQQSLRERILGNRSRDTHAGLKKKKTEHSSTRELPGNGFERSQKKNEDGNRDRIVKPDFSKLEALASTHLRKQIELPVPGSHLTPGQIPPDNSQTPVLVGPLPRIANAIGSSPKSIDSKDFPLFDPQKHETRLSEPAETIVVPPPSRDSNTKPLRKRDPISTVSSKSKLTKVRQRSQHLSIIANDYLTHTTIEGDTLHSISNKYYGKSDFYLDIYVSNRDQLKNPAVIPRGVKLKIPVYRNNLKY